MQNSCSLTPSIDAGGQQIPRRVMLVDYSYNLQLSGVLSVNTTHCSAYDEVCDFLLSAPLRMLKIRAGQNEPSLSTLRRQVDPPQ